MEKEIKWVTDLIGDDYKTWKPGDTVLLSSWMGTGKTSFFIEYGKTIKGTGIKMLYLCNRTKLQKQTYRKIKMAGLQFKITVKLYQTIERDLRRNKEEAMNELSQYEIIFVDECHYFTADAFANNYTDLSWKWLQNNHESIIIYASATAEIFFRWIAKKRSIPAEHIYHLPADFSYVSKVTIYKKGQLKPLLNHILATETDSKMVVFCNSEERMLEMYEEYRDHADFICSTSTHSKSLKRICNEEALEVTSNEKGEEVKVTFSKRILFSTSVLDNGVDFKDEQIKYIFTELSDIDSLIQSLGRKRPLPGKNDTCEFYIMEWTNQSINRLNNSNNTQLRPVTIFKNDRKQFSELFRGDKDLMKYNKIFWTDPDVHAEDAIRINVLRETKAMMNSMMYKEMMEVGFIQVVKNRLGKALAEKFIISDIQPEEYSLISFLKTVENKPLYVNSHELAVVKEHFKKDMSIQKKMTRSYGINTLNGWLNDNYGSGKKRYIPRFDSRKDQNRILEDGTPNPYYDKRYWILM